MIRKLTSVILLIAISLIISRFGEHAPNTPTKIPKQRQPAPLIENRNPKETRLNQASQTIMPVEATEAIRRILQGGPFPYERDGVIFHNRERRLPIKKKGYYREYTVVTPGSRDRGARRIIHGAGGELYYSPDHYQSFVSIQPP